MLFPPMSPCQHLPVDEGEVVGVAPLARVARQVVLRQQLPAVGRDQQQGVEDVLDLEKFGGARNKTLGWGVT